MTSPPYMTSPPRLSKQTASSNTGLIIQPQWIAPVMPENVILEGHSLVISHEKILDLLPAADARIKYGDWPVLRLPQQLVIPGLVNAHGHMAMTLLRGYADDVALMDWLEQHIWPVEAAFVNQTFVYDGTSLAIAEMISTGTTCGADAYFFPQSGAHAMLDAGFRGQVGMPIVQFQNAWASDEQDHIEKALHAHEQIKHLSLLSTAFAPHAPYTVSDQGFDTLRELSQQHAIPIHLHLHETRQEVEQCDTERPLQRIKNLGLLGPNLQSIHMTQLLDSEIQTLAETGTHVVHCPDSNLKLASGFCPIKKLHDAGINVAVGTDGAASNNKLDMLTEIRSAALLAKAVSGQATSISAFDALAMGTINGARMMGIEHKIGSLEPGKLADIVSVDFSAVNFQPVYHPVSQLVYTATGHQVSHVWINGKLKLEAGTHTHMDIPRILAKAAEWRNKILQR